MNFYKALFVDDKPKKKLDIKCGCCGVSMVEDTYGDVEISYCEECGMVMLSRDNLNDIVDRARRSGKSDDGYSSGFLLGLMM